MSSIVQSLDTPFERLALLPTTMNWLGTWEANTLYFKNSVVISPVDGAIYILVGATSVVDDVDPSASLLWDTVTPTTASGVNTVTGSDYIDVDNTDPQNPIVSNTGVLLIRAQNGLQVQGTTKNPLFVNTGVLFVREGLGIDITDDIVSNTGVISIEPGADISVTGDPFNPTVANTGVNSIVPGFNVTVSELPTERAGTAPFISVKSPMLTRFLNPNDVPDIDPIPYLGYAKIPVPNGSNPNSILFKYINGTPPDPTGGFLLDFGGWTYDLQPPLVFGLPTSSSHEANFYLYDSTTNKTSSYFYSAYSVIGASSPFYINIQPMFFEIQRLKDDGLTQITHFLVRNNFVSNGGGLQLILQSRTGTFATYYPTNLI